LGLTNEDQHHSTQAEQHETCNLEFTSQHRSLFLAKEYLEESGFSSYPITSLPEIYYFFPDVFSINCINNI
jgi:hypothetical protein